MEFYGIFDIIAFCQLYAMGDTYDFEIEFAVITVLILQNWIQSLTKTGASEAFNYLKFV